MKKLVLASNNAKKMKELNALLAPLGFEVIAQGQLGIPEAEEPHCTFVENALAKARHAAQLSGLPALADDSGLVVDALGGAPGVYSARYAGAGASDRANLDQLLAELRETPEGQRTARFQCVLALLRHPADPTPLICQASWEGEVLAEPRGAGGFGYDPIFFVPGEQLSAAELEPAVKNRLSHRGRALALLRQHLAATGAG